jgi:class 3 adenylate cyclase
MLTCPACGKTSPDDASFCAGCGGPLGATASTREVRKTVTALFCDLVGSTSLAEAHDPEVLRPLLHAYFAEMRGAVERHGGRVEKYIGDAVSAVFGLPTAHEDDALRAVRAAMEMQDRLAALAASSPFPFAARVGVTTGEVLVPAGGEPLIGDTMNTAARLQSGATPGEVLIGEPTWRLVRDAVAAEPVEPLVLRGKTEPVPAFRVLQVASLSPMRTRRLDAPMVGRAREAALLESAFERVASDRACQLFTVLGTAGAGKSRLVEEFLGSLDADDATVLRGRCLPYGEGITYLPVTEALRGALGLAEFAEVEDVRAAIAAAVAGEEHAAALEANLAPLFAAGSAGSPEETAWAIRRFLESRGGERPVVLVLDDIHWGEPVFLDLVEHLADWTRDAAILLLAMARPDLLDVRLGWGGGKTNATTISLAPLSDAECAQLIAYLLGSAALPDEIRARITRVAGGNPLFVEEMLRMLVDDGLLVRDGDTWTATRDLADVAVPPTIAALLSARLDRLSDDERRVLEAASVEGQGFHRGAVAALLPEAARAGLDTCLRSLVRKELVSPERSSLPGEDAYRFRHLLIRDAAYDVIPKSARSECHRAFADWLEGVAGDRVAEQQELVGYHLERAHRYREELGLTVDRQLRLRAGKALAAAGSRVVDGGDVGAAIQLLGQAADLLDGDAAQLPVLSNLVDALEDSRDYHGMVIAGERLELAATAIGDAPYGARGRQGAFDARVTLEPGIWDVETDRRLAEEALRLAREEGADHLVPYAVSSLAGIESYVGNNAMALGYAEELFRLAQQRQSRRLMRTALSWVTVALEYGAAPLHAALDSIEAFITGSADDRYLLQAGLAGRAWVNAWLGRTDRVASDISAVRSIDRELGRPDSPLRTVTEGYATWVDEGPAAAEPLFARAHRMITDSGEMVFSDFSGVPLARTLLEIGRHEESARVTLDLQRHTVVEARIQARTMGAVVAARHGDLEEALRLSAEAEAIAAPTDCLIDQADVALDRAEILLLAGRPHEARAAAADALERFERKEYAIGIRRGRAFLAALPE